MIMGDVISFVGGDGEKFIVLDDLQFGVYVNRINNGQRDYSTRSFIPNVDNYMKVCSWDFIDNKEIGYE